MMKKSVLTLVLLLASTITFAQPEFLTELPSDADRITEFKGHLYFSSGNALYQYNTGINQIEHIMDFGEPVYKTYDLYAEYGIAGAGTEPFFTFDQMVIVTGTDTTDFTLWTSDGSPTGTKIVATFKYIRSFIQFNNEVFFTADDGISGRELWKITSDNTVVRVTDINQGAGHSLPEVTLYRWYDSAPAVYQNELYFPATDTDGISQLWKSTGEAGNATLVKTFDQAYLADPYPSELTVVEDSLYFVITTASNIPIDTLYRYFAGNNSLDAVYGTSDQMEYFIADLYSINSTLFFTEYDRHIPDNSMYSLINNEVTELVNASGAGPNSQLMEVSNKLFLANYTDYYIFRYSFTDGTPQGTYSIENFSDQPYSEHGTEEVFNYKDSLLFYGKSKPDTINYNPYRQYSLKVYIIDQDSSYYLEDVFVTEGKVGYPLAVNFRQIGDYLYFTSTVDNSLLLYRYIPIEPVITSKNSAANNLKLTIRPNPAVDYVHISTNEKIENVILTDITGSSYDIELVNNKVNVSYLNPGIYFIQIQTPSGEKMGKLVKR